MKYVKKLPVNIENIRISGELGKRINLSLAHLVRDRRKILSGEGPAQTWGADQFGRWIYAVTIISRYLNITVPEISEAVETLLQNQQPDGFFCKKIHSGTLFGAARGLAGLLQYWQTTHDIKVLDATKRYGNYIITNLSAIELNQQGAGHEEGLVELWRATRDIKYLDFAEKLSTMIKDVSSPSLHSHMYLMSINACVELFFETGKAEYLTRAQNVWAYIFKEKMWVSGGVAENLENSFEVQDEGCAVADWLLLSLKLWQATGESQYMDIAEITLLNHLFFDQDSSGGFCMRRSIEEDNTGQIRDFVAWFCCSMHGARMLLESIGLIYTYDDDGIDVNFYIPSKATISQGNNIIHIEQITKYPSDFSTCIRISPEKDNSVFELRIRIPEWAYSFNIYINNQLFTGSITKGYFIINRKWKLYEVVEVVYYPEFKIIQAGKNSFNTMKINMETDNEKRLKNAAIVYGPVVLMYDPCLNYHELYTLGHIEMILPIDESGKPYLTRVEVPIPGRCEISIDKMCFMTLGRKQNNESKLVEFNEESWKLIFLVPISEITDRRSTTTTRNIPYEIRNDIRFLHSESDVNYTQCLNKLFDNFIENICESTLMI